MATSEFGKAFAEARRQGKKTFDFGGKSYHTRTAAEDTAAKKEARDSEMRSKSDMLVALQRAERNAPPETSDYARKQIAEARGRAAAAYENAPDTGDETARLLRRRPAPAPTENLEATGETFKRGGKVGSASKRGDGIAQRGKTRGTLVMCKGGRM